MSDPIVTLLTDFGLRDGYVGAMKGTLLSRCPSARLVDLSHEVAAGDVAAASWILAQASPWFPEGSLHLVVVDPGVGSERRGLACAIGSQRYVAPDNGVLSAVLARASDIPVRAFALTNRALWREPVSPVFHGRDVFAPVAGFLAAGGDLAEAGDPVPVGSVVRLPWPEPRIEGGARVGCVVHVDRFGNLVTNLPAPGDAPLAGAVEAGGRSVPTGRTYSDVARGALVALRGSSGLLEIACNGGSAAAALGGSEGLVVVWRG